MAVKIGIKAVRQEHAHPTGEQGFLGFIGLHNKGEGPLFKPKRLNSIWETPAGAKSK